MISGGGASATLRQGNGYNVGFSRLQRVEGLTAGSQARSTEARLSTTTLRRTAAIQPATPFYVRCARAKTDVVLARRYQSRFPGVSPGKRTFDPANGAFCTASAAGQKQCRSAPPTVHAPQQVRMAGGGAVDIRSA